MTDRHVPAPPPQALLGPLKQLLRPLVRLAIRSGVTFPALTDLLRESFVEIAVSEVLRDPKAQTDSRVSLLTGIHRKEVRRLRSLEPTEQSAPPTLGLTSLVIARWAGIPEYCDQDGKPLVLARLPVSDGPSFEELVRSVTTDVRPRTVLDDLIDQKIVMTEDGDRVRLDVAAFIPRAGRDEQLFYFGRNLHDHIAAAVENVMAVESPPFLDRSVHYDSLTPEAAHELEHRAREVAIGTLIEINRMALGIADDPRHNAKPGEASRRVNLGMYLYSEDESAAAAPSQADEAQ